MTRAASGPRVWSDIGAEKSSGSRLILSDGCFRVFLTRTGSSNLYTNCNLTVDHSHAKRRHSRCESFITRRWAPFPRSPAVKDVPFFWRGTTFHRTDKHYCVIFEIFLRADAFVIVMKLGTWWLGVFLLKSFHFDCDYCSYSQQERTCQHAMSFCSRPISILSCITQ